MIYTDLRTMKKKFYSPVKEEFYGRTKNIEIMYENCCKICDTLNGMSFYESLKYETYFSKYNVEIQQAMCREFGFKKSIVAWDKTGANLAMTIPGGLFIEKHAGLKDSVILKKKNDKYYDSTHEFTCILILTNGFVRNAKLNGEELMGIILHEIGHNFERRKYVFVNLYLAQLFHSFGFFDIIQYAFRNGLSEYMLNFEKEYPNIALISNIAYQIFNEFKHVINYFSGGFLDLILHFSYFILRGKYIFIPLMLKTEQFADSFAAKYGFGPGLISGLQKLHKVENDSSFVLSNIGKIPVLRTVMDIMHGPSKLMTELFLDEHPVEEIRYKNIKADLVNDYNDPEIPKEMKPLIKNQIEQCEKMKELDKKDPSEKQKIFTLFKKYFINDILPTDLWVDKFYH